MEEESKSEENNQMQPTQQKKAIQDRTVLRFVDDIIFDAQELRENAVSFIRYGDYAIASFPDSHIVCALLEHGDI